MKFTAANQDLMKIRAVKTKKEIIHIRKACTLTDQCFSYIKNKIRVGITERQLASYIERFMLAHHADVSFPPIVAFGAHTSQPHYQIPLSYNSKNEERLKKNTFLLFDFGAKVNGYCADMTRVLYFGNTVPSAFYKAYITVLNTQNKIIEKLSTHSGVCYRKKYNNFSGACLDRFAKKYIKKSGFIPFSHSVGHGLGLDVHEYPRLTMKKDQPIMPEMVFTIEPGIYIAEQFGIRIEDTVYLSDDGLEILTKSSKDLKI